MSINVTNNRYLYKHLIYYNVSTNVYIISLWSCHF